ncbi:DUF5994 family protein [Streptacidiphilus neutrinimicus]|uniref:DUF5994 family protein n=1 Tax=Streptacidiphilus neutrinimicus TaxID=105420 RepID=UPI0005A8417D|nr:DUF5994 family protein [Streptacidiphilus neutrinimicus]
MSVSLMRPPSVALPPPRTESPVLRLALRPAAGGGGLPVGALDGAWWPHSDDLLRELPSLIPTLDRVWGRITRVNVNPRHWESLPREVPVRGHVVKVGWFTTEQDPHKLLLLSYRTGRWDLLVIPPQTSQAAAARLMAAAGDPAGSSAASALLAAERDRSVDDATNAADAPARDIGAEAAWESEGGAARSVPLIMPIGRISVSSGR